MVREERTVGDTTSSDDRYLYCTKGRKSLGQYYRYSLSSTFMLCHIIVVIDYIQKIPWCVLPDQLDCLHLP